jgi:hypothetical protein
MTVASWEVAAGMAVVLDGGRRLWRGYDAGGVSGKRAA